MKLSFLIINYWQEINSWLDVTKLLFVILSTLLSVFVKKLARWQEATFSILLVLVRVLGI